MTEGLPLAAPVWLFRVLLLLTFLLHVLAMNTLAGGAVIAAVTSLRGGRNPLARVGVGKYRAAAPVLVAATVTLGVAPLLFMQVLYGRFFFASSIVMAWAWLAVVLLVMVAYALTYAASWSRMRDTPRAVLLWATTGLLLLVGFIYTNNMTLMLTPDRVMALFQEDGRGLRLNLGEPTLLPRYLHIMIGAVAIAGLVLAVTGALQRRREPEFGAWAVRHGLHWFAGATAVNIAVGVWWLFLLPVESRGAFLGGDLYASIVLLSGMAAGLVATAAAIAGVMTGRTTTVWVAAVMAVGSMVGMILARDAVREIALAPIVEGQVLTVAAQWVPIGLFVVFLVAALGTVAWMIARISAPGLKTRGI